MNFHVSHRVREDGNRVTINTCLARDEEMDRIAERVKAGELRLVDEQAGIEFYEVIR